MPKGMIQFLHRLWCNAHGNTAVAFAVAAPALIVLVGMAVDMAGWNTQKTHLQAAADAAAIAGASELYLANATQSQVRSTVSAVGAANLKASGSSGEDGDRAQFETSIDFQGGTIKVNATQSRHRLISSLVPMTLSPLHVSATARALGGGKVCAIMTEKKEPHTFELTKSSRFTAKGCAIYSNSTSPASLYVHQSAKLTADLICTAGGKSGARYNFSPQPQTDCPAIPDPLEHRPTPTVGSCDYMRKALSGGTHTLYPGTYCNGLLITNGAKVTMRPGIYVIKNGPIIVERGGSLTGQNTGFFFTGTYAGIQFLPKSHVDLKAPKDGLMAGLLFFEDRNMAEEPKQLPLHKVNVGNKNNQLAQTVGESLNLVSTINGTMLWPANDVGKKVFGKTVRQLIASDDARNLLGTIYFPNGKLHVAGANPVADQSAYTIIVARKLQVDEGPELVLNTGYDQTDVPVPDGVGPIKANVTLVN